MEADLPWIGEVDLFDEETGELAPDAPFVVTAIDVWTSGIDENDPAVSISPIERVKLARLRARGYDKGPAGHRRDRPPLKNRSKRRASRASVVNSLRGGTPGGRILSNAAWTSAG